MVESPDIAALVDDHAGPVFAVNLDATEINILAEAPASATAGAVETVGVSWSGLVAGTTYLGAVSHTGDVGLMGLTLVEVEVEDP